MKTIEVVAAVIIKDDLILCMQRNDGPLDYISRKYEFPGGKIEENEAHHVALMRELIEEMNLDLRISPEDYYMTVDHTYPDFRIIMHSYICRVTDINFIMNEHIDFRWLPKEQLRSLDWAPADLPIVERLCEED